MEEKNKYQELREIVQEIQSAIKTYNDLNPEEKLVLTKEKEDVSDIYICAYNEKYVGLFEERRYHSTYKAWSSNQYNAGSIYVGVNSNNIGMRLTHNCEKNVDIWQPIGTSRIMGDNTYISNCHITDAIAFDNMRLMMYENGELDSFEMGKASSQEMLDVLKYAKKYYQSGQKQKTK